MAVKVAEDEQQQLPRAVGVLPDGAPSVTRGKAVPAPSI